MTAARTAGTGNPGTTWDRAPELLVSVRSAAEAGQALEGGAGLIDVKEPGRGPLGRADAQTIAEVAAVVAGRRPVSAALGELVDFRPEGLPRFPEADATGIIRRLDYVKLGTARCGLNPRWEREFLRAGDVLGRLLPSCRVVPVAYADWQPADAPRPEEVCVFACRQASAAVVFDTFHKDGKTLLDWLPLPELMRLCSLCRTGGVRVALAGSLGTEEIRVLRALRPDWLAVRGAACRGGRRDQPIDVERVRRLARLVSTPVRVARCGD